MGAFLEAEYDRQACFKATDPSFSAEARCPGLYRGRLRPFCLPVEQAVENLFPGIRESLPAYFGAEAIKWHQGQHGAPSNHMCSSQVCCANFFFPLADRPLALAALLRPLYPTLAEMLPLERGWHVAFEWIGQENYLHEVSRNGLRSRGANYTSADAAVMFRHGDGRRQIVLIEWKYTEAYAGTPLQIARSGRDRTTIYRWLYDRADCPLDRQALPSFAALFYEPFYQLLRQQFLAHEMERARELDADVVSTLHIAPAHNEDFRRVTSPDLQCLGHSPTGIWARLVRAPERFLSVNTEDLFGRFAIDEFPELGDWWRYIHARYGWVVEPVRSGDMPGSYPSQR